MNKSARHAQRNILPPQPIGDYDAHVQTYLQHLIDVVGASEWGEEDAVMWEKAPQWVGVYVLLMVGL